jgi:hypothetical protein
MAMVATAVVVTNAVASGKEPALPVFFIRTACTGMSELHYAEMSLLAEAA